VSLDLATLPDELHALDLPGLSGQLDLLREALPGIRRASERLGGKRQTQFMDRVLTVGSQSTPERAARQCLAELDKVLGALRSAHYRTRKSTLKAAIQREKAASRSGLKAELALVKAEEIESGIVEGQRYVAGAVRRAAGLVVQHRAILEYLGAEEITEADMERAEERHHIRTAFAQGLASARARGGTIDEGNTLYLTQLGINVATAQAAVARLLTEERQLLASGREPDHALVEDWLADQVAKFAGCSAHVRARGLAPNTVRLALTSEEGS
jgi:hypothetical protein